MQLILPNIKVPPRQYAGMFLMWDSKTGYNISYWDGGQWVVAYALCGSEPERREDTFLELEAVTDEVVAFASSAVGWRR